MVKLLLSVVKKFIPVLVLILVLGAVVSGLYLLVKKNEASQNLGPAVANEYYWGAGCPHCAVVQEFMNTWEGRDKVKLEKYEVWNNQTNFKRMQSRANQCGLDKNSLGVPLLYTLEGKCLAGDTPIIEFFKSLKY